MKKVFLTFSFLLILFSVTAQYKVDWANAPMNPILQAYTQNHEKILGNVASRKEGNVELIFNKNGALLLTRSMMPFKYFYDQKGHIKNQETPMGNYTFICDEAGRVIQMNKDNVGSLKFTYNEKGLWTRLTDLKTGSIDKNYFYDDKGRLVKEEDYYKGKLAMTTVYSYAMVNDILEVKMVQSEIGKPAITDVRKFNNRGDCIFRFGKAIRYTYDHHNNILSINDGTDVTIYRYTYYDEVAKIPETKISAKTDCMSGNCENGYGSKQIGEFLYIGFFENGKPDGPGLLTKNNFTLLGTWKNGINAGYGLYSEKETGNIAQGYFKDLALNGRAVRKQNGKFQYGNFSAGELILPAYQTPRNNLSVGCIVGDCSQKYGQYLFQNGSKFTGFFKDGNVDVGIFSDTKKNTYNGEFKNGKLDGFGQQSYLNGDSYFGFFKNGMRHGKGSYQIKGTPSKILSGFWENDKLIKNLSDVLVTPNLLMPTPSGPGLIDVATIAETSSVKKTDCNSGDCENGYGVKTIGDMKYLGFFENGKQNGPGILYKKNYTLWSVWKNGVNTGYGILNDKNTEYTADGYFENLVLNGRAGTVLKGKGVVGKFEAGNLVGSSYKLERTSVNVGCVVGDCVQLYGRYNFANGTNYTGFFTDGNPQAGQFSDSEKNNYNGEYKNGKQDGLGKQTYVNGDFYFGFFKNGMRHGKGFYNLKGTPSKELRGVWENDKFIKDLSGASITISVLQATPVGPGILSIQNTINAPFNSNSDNLGFGNAAPHLNNANNSALILKLYPGYSASDKKFIANKISAEAAKKASEEESIKYIAEKIEELYALNKTAAYNAFIWISPEMLGVKSQKYIPSDIKKFFVAEMRRGTAEYLKKNH